MAYDVVYTGAAERDVRRIVSYLLAEAGNRPAAERFLTEIEGLVERLSHMPEMYPQVSEGRASEHGYRKASFLSHVAIYRVLGQTVEIGRIFHAKQGYARLL